MPALVQISFGSEEQHPNSSRMSAITIGKTGLIAPAIDGNLITINGQIVLIGVTNT